MDKANEMLAALLAVNSSVATAQKLFKDGKSQKLFYLVAKWVEMKKNEIKSRK